MKLKEKTVAKVKLDTTWSARQRSERCEIRCSKNFSTLVDALKSNTGYSKVSTSDVLHRAIKCLAEKEGLLLAGDSHYI